MTAPNVTLHEGESLIDDREELLYRQILEWMVPDGAILTHVFGPSTADQGKPSYSRSSVVSAQDARDWHNEPGNGNSKSTGVWAVSVDEVFEAETFAIDDAAAPLEEDRARAPGHCYVDYRQMTKVDIKSVRFLLYQRAMARGEITTTARPNDGELFVDLPESTQ
ncbi:hypothetical protein [Microbacterium jejuense]|uniref:hypothetical protein n=1 Tax=Microbacterium jejuense TaxID=1263637 RepID=UPI0031EC0B36